MKRPKFTPTNFIMAICVIIFLPISIYLICSVIFVIRQYDICNLEYTQTEHIGNIIGGFTTPIVGLISIWLLYKTFMEQRRFNEKQSEFNNEQNKFNTTLLEFDKKQLELDHYVSCVTLLETITDKLHSIEINCKDNVYTGIENIYINRSKLKDVDKQELEKLKDHLVYCHRLIRTFLRTNKDAELKKTIKVTLYKIMKDMADKLPEIYDIVKMGQSNTQKTWADELREYLEKCNPENEK